MKAEKAPTDTDKSTLDTEEAKIDAEEAILKKHKEAAKKAKLLETKFVWIFKLSGLQNKQLETEP